MAYRDGQTFVAEKGFWRQIYTGNLRDRRFEMLSWFEEVVYYRLFLFADDFGHAPATTLHGDLFVFRVGTEQQISIDEMQAALDKLVAAGFIRRYEARGEKFIEIIDYDQKRRNGKRVRRWPLPVPSEPTIADRSGSIQVDPSASQLFPGALHHSQTETRKENQKQDMNVEAVVDGSPEAYPEREMAEAIFKLYPKPVKKQRSIAAIQGAMRRLKDRGEADPGAWLTQKVSAFARSPAGDQGMYTPDPATWFDQERYDEPETAWQEPKQRARADGNRSRGATNLGFKTRKTAS
jgi:hypothetical protein